MEKKLTFSTFLRDIKTRENYTNAKLAKYMDCSEATVSLCLANKSFVSYGKIAFLAKSLKEIENKDLYDYVFSYFPDGFYHGSRQGILGDIDPNLNKHKSLDFGHGFYLGTTFKQSSTFVAGIDDGKDRIYKFNMSFDGLDVLELRDVRWVLFVAYNRKKIPDTKENQRLIREIQKTINRGYDVIVGPIADDKMAISMDNFFNNNISYGQLLDCLTQLSIGDQYCLKTEKACRNLSYETIYTITDDGLRNLIREYAFESTIKASKHAEAVNRISDTGKKFSDLLKEYGKKPLF